MPQIRWGTARSPHGAMATRLSSVWLAALLRFAASSTTCNAEQECASGGCGDSQAAVRQSGLSGAGLGAFAMQSFARGETVGHYACTIVPSSESNGLYSWTINSTHMCDGEAHRLANPMRYVNSVAGSSSCAMLN
eukprot:3016132-Prymnesium_polylepis.1